ncbi:hypothetical protein M885DRAFT_611114 [Pelagophyceae sp. CCMP2097]|nr:hypothetical protein M885DRAFT_611114 [Pelagophyceae sp. CCMP2097]
MVLLVTITMGGPRMHALLSQSEAASWPWFEAGDDNWSLEIARRAFGEETPPRLDGFDLEYSQGILGDAVVSEQRATDLAGDVLDAIGFDAAQRLEFAQLAARARPANRRVLGCLLANLRAMRVSAQRRREGKVAMVLEDNARACLDGASERVGAALEAANAAGIDLVYLGHLAHDDTMARVRDAPRDQGGLAEVPESVGAVNHELWGTYAYSCSEALYSAVLEHIRTGFPKSLFKLRWRDAEVTPIDKMLQRVARARGLHMRALAAPAFYRMPPAMPSKIHQKWDNPFLKSTSLQLRLYGLTWSRIWLTPAEMALAVEAEAAAVEAEAEAERRKDDPPVWKKKPRKSKPRRRKPKVDGTAAPPDDADAPPDDADAPPDDDDAPPDDDAPLKSALESLALESTPQVKASP